MSCDLQQLLLTHPFRMDLFDLEHALSQGTGLVKDKGIRPCNVLQVIASLHHDPLAGRRRDPSQERDWDRHDQATWAGHDQKDQSPVDPCIPVPIREGKRRIDHHQKSQHQHNRRIDPGKPGDRGLTLCLFILCFLHHLHDLGDSRILINLGNPGFDHAPQIDAAAVDPVSHSCAHRHRLTGHRLGINGSGAAGDHRVHRDPLAGLDDNDMVPL